MIKKTFVNSTKIEIESMRKATKVKKDFREEIKGNPTHYISDIDNSLKLSIVYDTVYASRHINKKYTPGQIKAFNFKDYEIAFIYNDKLTSWRHIESIIGKEICLKLSAYEVDSEVLGHVPTELVQEVFEAMCKEEAIVVHQGERFDEHWDVELNKICKGEI